MTPLSPSLRNGDDIQHRELRFDAIAKHQPKTLRQVGAARERRYRRSDGRSGAILRNAEDQSAAIGIGERHDLFQDPVSCVFADPASAVKPRIGTGLACLAGFP